MVQGDNYVSWGTFLVIYIWISGVMTAIYKVCKYNFEYGCYFLFIMFKYCCVNSLNIHNHYVLQAVSEMKDGFQKCRHKAASGY